MKVKINKKKLVTVDSKLIRLYFRPIVHLSMKYLVVTQSFLAHSFI